LQVLPFFGMGLCMGLVTIWWERHHIGTSGGVFKIGLLDRLLIASRAVWFYFGKLLWPVNLTFSYPHWSIDASQPLAYAWLALCGLACGAIYWARKFMGRSPEVAAAFYLATLSPTLGFIMLFTFRYTFVADHYQYVACIGPLTLAAAGTTWAIQRFSSVPRIARNSLALVLIVLLAGLTWHQARAYRSSELLWRDTVAKNPDSWMAHGNLGRLLMHRGQFDEAMAQYQEALRINPRDVDSLVSVGNALFGKGRHDEAADFYGRALAVNPLNPEAHVNLAVILANRGRVEEAIDHDRQALRVNPIHVTAHVNLAVMLASSGRYEEALEHYRAALETSPDQPLTHINLAIALAALGRSAESADQYRIAAALVNKHAASLAQQGRTPEAAAQYSEAIRMIPNNAEAHYGLGILLLKLGKTSEAVEHFSEALRLKPGYSDAERQLRALKPGR
jgi:tetratricopeptide (TPR) repeat protein